MKHLTQWFGGRRDRRSNETFGFGAFIPREPDSQRVRTGLSLRLTPKAWLKLQFFRDIGPTEVGFFGISRLDDLLFVEDIVLVAQESSCATVEFTEKGLADHWESHETPEGDTLESARIWIHTHPGSSAHPSGTDETTFAEYFGKCSWAVMAILARGGETYARLHLKGPGEQGQVFEEEIPFRVDWSRADVGTLEVDQWRADYKRLVENLDLRPRTYVDSYPIGRESDRGRDSRMFAPVHETPSRDDDLRRPWPWDDEKDDWGFRGAVTLSEPGLLDAPMDGAYLTSSAHFAVRVDWAGDECVVDERNQEIRDEDGYAVFAEEFFDAEGYYYVAPDGGVITRRGEYVYDIEGYLLVENEEGNAQEGLRQESLGEPLVLDERDGALPHLAKGLNRQERRAFWKRQEAMEQEKQRKETDERRSFDPPF